MELHPKANTMRERAGESPIKLWLLLRANRFQVTAVIAVFAFLSFLIVGLLAQSLEPTVLASGDPLETLFSTLIGGIITGTTLVVTISQLVISQENGPLGDQRRRMSDALDFRNFTERFVGSATPTDPSTFLKEIVAASARFADQLQEATPADHPASSQIDELQTSLTENAAVVCEDLESASFGSFEVVYAALNYNHSYKLAALDRLDDAFGEDLSSEQQQTIGELETSLAMYGGAREHIKTLYFEWALMKLSKYILYAAIPALLSSGIMLAFADEVTLSGTVLGMSVLLLVTSLAFTLAILPFLLFASYVFRIATVAQRTLAMGPLILRESER